MPGRILPPEQWVKTALKRIPPGQLDWKALFGRDAPVVLDIGCGNGRSTLTSAVARPDVDHFAIDTLPVVIRYATRRGNQRGLHNVRFAVIDGAELLAEHVAAGSLAEIHLFHPQPYYDAAQAARRLITPEFLRLAHQALSPGGKLLLQTDHGAYWNYMKSIVPCFFQLHERDTPWPDAPRGRSRREIIARQQRLPIYRGEAIRRDDITAAAALQLASQLPPPTFHADPRLREIDRLETSVT